MCYISVVQNPQYCIAALNIIRMKQVAWYYVSFYSLKIDK